MIKIAWSPMYNHPLPAGHRFPMLKYDLLKEQLLYEGTAKEVNFFEPLPMEEDVVSLTHDKDYIRKLHDGTLTAHEIRVSGFPYSKSLIEREYALTHGTVQAAMYALEHGIAFNIAGGTHHAFRDRAEGFCIFNDLAVAANYLISEMKAGKILIIDLDVHQGNGTASIFEGREDVFTFSMHGENNFPIRKERSHLDVALNDGTRDVEYLHKLEENLANIIPVFQPDMILYQSGVDVLETDKLGRMKLSMAGCRERDKKVLQLAYTQGIPLVAAMGGGYSADIKTIIEAHAGLYRLAFEMYV